MAPAMIVEPVANALIMRRKANGANTRGFSGTIEIGFYEICEYLEKTIRNYSRSEANSYHQSIFIISIYWNER